MISNTNQLYIFQAHKTAQVEEDRLRREVGDLLVKLQNAEEASKDGVAKLQEELNKVKAQLAEQNAVNATRYRIIDLQKAAEDSEKRSSEQANDLKMLQMSHKKALADKDTEMKAAVAESEAQFFSPHTNSLQ